MNVLKRWFAVLLILVSLIVPIYSIETDTSQSAQAISEQATPRAEQTQWYYRVYNGKKQKRLWSITNQCWLTDWIDC